MKRKSQRKDVSSNACHGGNVWDFSFWNWQMHQSYFFSEGMWAWLGILCDSLLHFNDVVYISEYFFCTMVAYTRNFYPIFLWHTFSTSSPRSFSFTSTIFCFSFMENSSLMFSCSFPHSKLPSENGTKNSMQRTLIQNTQTSVCDSWKIKFFPCTCFSSSNDKKSAPLYNRNKLISFVAVDIPLGKYSLKQESYLRKISRIILHLHIVKSLGWDRCARGVERFRECH